MRALMEGKSKVQGNFLTSLYWEGNAASKNNTYLPVEVVLPIHMSGILSGKKVFPCILTDGLRIRITLSDSARALQAFTQVGYSINGAGATTLPAPTIMNEAGAYFESDVAIAAGNLTTITLKDTGATAPNVNATSANCAFRVGQELAYETTAGGTVSVGAITDITVVANQVVLTFAQVVIGAGDVAAIGAKVFCLVSSLVADYEVRNVDFVCSVVQASQEVINGMVKKVNQGSVKLDYNTFNLYRSNLNARVNRPNILLPTTEHRSMSILSYPMRTQNALHLPNFRPVTDGMLNYQWLIANRLTPNRRVDVSRVAVIGNTQEWNAIHQHELEKALGRGKIAPRYLAKNSKMFGIGRELAKVNHSFNANDQDLRLDMEYSTAAADNTEEKLLNSWVHHIRTLVISPGSVAVTW